VADGRKPSPNKGARELGRHDTPAQPTAQILCNRRVILILSHHHGGTETFLDTQQQNCFSFLINLFKIEKIKMIISKHIHINNINIYKTMAKTPAFNLKIKNIDVRIDPKTCNTPLMTCCFLAKLGEASMLLDHGASVTATNTAGETCLHLAAKSQGKGGLAIVEIVASKFTKRQIDQACSNGWTALHLAIKRGSLMRVQTLVQQGASVHLPNRIMAGQTPLMAAAQAAHLEICE